MFLYATLVVLTLMKEREIRPLLTLKEQSFFAFFQHIQFSFFFKCCFRIPKLARNPLLELRSTAFHLLIVVFT